MNKTRHALERALCDPDLAGKVDRATGITLRKRETLIRDSYPDWESLRESASEIRSRSVALLPDLVRIFTASVEAEGGNITIVEDYDELCRVVEEILRPYRDRPIVKGKSMLTEETGLRDFLGMRGYEVVETDLGEFIIQLLDQSPSHITAPAIHLSRHDISRIFRERLGGPDTTDPQILTRFARTVLRKKFLKAQAGITGANFLVAESGTVVLLENEANIRLSSTLPDVVISIAGVEKLIERTTNLSPLLKLLPASATAQIQNCYTSFLPPDPRRHIVLLAGKRMSLREDPVGSEILKCIRCGACLNTCPVFRLVGGHGYGTVYSGPMGAILTPLLSPEHRSLPYMSSLCGACTDICPVHIPLHRLLLELRSRSRKDFLSSSLFTLFRAGANPRAYGMGTSIFRKLPNTIRRRLLGPWTRKRGTFPVSPESFREKWRRRKRERNHA